MHTGAWLARAQALRLAWDGHRHHMPRQAVEGAQITQRILVREHAADQVKRALAMFLHVGHGARYGLGAMRIVAAIQPHFRALGCRFDKRPLVQPLQPRRPFHGR